MLFKIINKNILNGYHLTSNFYFLFPRFTFLMLLLIIAPAALSQSLLEKHPFVIARVKYRGGGDWYNDPSAIPNLSVFLKKETGITIAEEEAKISLSDKTLFSYPFLFLTGHGKLAFTDNEVEALRTYLLKGGFLYADDDYGMDLYFRETMKRVFPHRELQELPFAHQIYHIHFSFDHGLPKIHEHDDNPPQGYGIFDDNNRLMVFYTYETNISDGWASPEIHNDPPEKREQALRMGANIVIWAFLN
jgi:hypothetical protein